MIRCVMSARVLAVVESLPLSSVPTSLVYNTTVSIAGPRSTPDPAVSSTSHLWKRELIDPVLYHSAGVKERKMIVIVKIWRDVEMFSVFELGGWFLRSCIVFIYPLKQLVYKLTVRRYGSFFASDLLGRGD